MIVKSPRWYLGQTIPDGWLLPDYTSRSISVARAMKIKNKKNRLMVLRRAVKLARDGVLLDRRYQK